MPRRTIPRGRVSVSDSLYERQKRYYDLRAPEYDRGAWEPETALQAAEHARIVDVLTALPPARTLDVGCGREARVLEDGSTHEIYKVYFTPESLRAEVGGGEFLHSGSVFMALRRSWGDPEGT